MREKKREKKPKTQTHTRCKIVSSDVSRRIQQKHTRKFKFRSVIFARAKLKKLKEKNMEISIKTETTNVKGYQ